MKGRARRLESARGTRRQWSVGFENAAHFEGAFGKKPFGSGIKQGGAALCSPHSKSGTLACCSQPGSCV